MDPNTADSNTASTVPDRDPAGPGRDPASVPGARRSRCDELVDEQGAASFPASDPPSMWTGAIPGRSSTATPSRPDGAG